MDSTFLSHPNVADFGLLNGVSEEGTQAINRYAWVSQLQDGIDAWWGAGHGQEGCEVAAVAHCDYDGINPEEEYQHLQQTWINLNAHVPSNNYNLTYLNHNIFTITNSITAKRKYNYSIKSSILLLPRWQFYSHHSLYKLYFKYLYTSNKNVLEITKFIYSRF